MSEHKVHVGQPVRESREGTNRGCVCIVDAIATNGFLILKGGLGCWDAKSFEPAYALEVGCKVRVVDCDKYPRYNGHEGIMTEVYGDMILIDDMYQFDEEYLIVLEPAPKKVKPQGVFACIDESSTFGGTAYEAIMKLMKDERPITCGTPVRGESVHGTITGKWADNIKIYGGNVMKKENYEKLAKKMNDEYVGNGFHTVFLKKAGECSVEVRDVTMTLTPSDIEAILKEKGISKALGTFEMDEIYQDITVKVVKFTPIESTKKKSKKNEAD